MVTKLPMRDMVVFIPGILGSVLTRDGAELWGVSPSSLITNLLHLARNINWLKLPDGIGHNDPADGVVASRLMPGLHLLPRFWKIDGYGKLIAFLESRFSLSRPTTDQPGNLIEFPYDWRLSNELTAQKLEQRLVPALARWREHSNNPDAKLILICHSMGGLIARHFLEVLSGRELTRTLITIGTPYQGSINALDALVNGSRIPPVGPRLDELVRSFPAVYQLLPTYECLDVGNGFLKGLGTVSLPAINDANVGEGLAFHSRIKAAVSSSPSYTTCAIKGIAQPTYQSAVLARGTIEPRKEINGLDRGGDGTVARPSAHPPEWPDERHSIFVSQHHAMLQSADNILQQLFGAFTGQLGGWMAEVAKMGLDIPDLVPAGAPVPVTVKLEDGDPTWALQAICYQEDGQPTVGPILLKSVGRGHYKGQFNDLAPGAYRITVQSAVPKRPVDAVCDWTLVWDDQVTIC